MTRILAQPSGPEDAEKGMPLSFPFNNKLSYATLLMMP
jgi:hypothetical protein